MSVGIHVNTVQVNTVGIGTVVSLRNTVRIQDRNQFEHKPGEGGIGTVVENCFEDSVNSLQLDLEPLGFFHARFKGETKCLFQGS